MSTLVFLGWFFASFVALWALVELVVALPRIGRWARKWLYRRPLDFIARKAGKRSWWICKKLFHGAQNARWKTYGRKK